MDGNFFRIPSEILEAHRVEGESPEGAALAGEEVSEVLRASAAAFMNSCCGLYGQSLSSHKAHPRF